MASHFDMSVCMSLSRKPRWCIVNFEKLELCVLDGVEVLVDARFTIISLCT